MRVTPLRSIRIGALYQPSDRVAVSSRQFNNQKRAPLRADKKIPASAGGTDAGILTSELLDQVQVIRPFADELQVLVVSVCEAAAVHEAGGPATAVAVTVTFCEGEKPCAVPLPEKYTPELSAA
jgi:hypothetical protein